MMTVLRLTLVGLMAWSWTSVLKAEEPVIISLHDGKAKVTREAPKYVQRAVAAANQIVGKPYKWGGGHAVLVDEGYDCSGAVSYVLREAGLMTGVGTSRDFLKFGEEGEGEWITVWARNGHVFLTIAGFRFDTLGQTEEEGPRWYREPRKKRGHIARRVKLADVKIKPAGSGDKPAGSGD